NIGQYVTHDNMAAGSTETARCQHIIHLADLQHLTAHKSAQTSPAKQAKDYHGVGEVRAIHCDETQNDYQGRHGGNDLDQSLNGNIDPTAIVTGNSAQRNTDHKT